MMNYLSLKICCSCNSDSHKCANFDTFLAKTGTNEINSNFTIKRHLNYRNIGISIGPQTTLRTLCPDMSDIGQRYLEYTRSIGI